MVVFKRSVKKREIKLEEVSQLLNQLRLPTSLVFTPVNLDQEQARFFESESYNPQFRYRIVKNKNDQILDMLAGVEQISDIDPRLSEFYVKLIRDKALTNEMMNCVGDNKKVSEISLKRFRAPTAVLFRNAARVLRGNVESYRIVNSKLFKKGDPLRYDQIKSIFMKVFESFGLDGWECEKSLNIIKNGVKTGTKRKQLLLDPNIEKRPMELRKTIAHELIHIIRSHNGEGSGYDALSKANIASYLDTEEGLATFNEEQLGLLSLSDLKSRAGKVWAVYMGQEMSFRELYNAALAIVPRKMAFKLVYRVKRGMGDTSKPGIYARDVAYFRGFRKIRRKVAEDSTLYAKLFAGKISIKQLDWVDDGILRKARIVPTSEQFEAVFKACGI